MSADPPGSDAERFRLYIMDVAIEPPITNPNCRISAKIFIDEQPVCTFPWLDSTQPSRWSRLQLCDVSSHSNIVLRLYRSVKEKQRSFNFPAYQISEAGEGTGEATLEHPDLVWMVTLKYLTPDVAEQFFPEELEKFRNIEGVYDSLKPEVTTKYLFKIPLQFAIVVAEVLPVGKLPFLVFMRTWELLDQQGQLDDTIQNILRGLVHIQDVVKVLRQASDSILATIIGAAKEPINNILLFLESVSVHMLNRLAGKHTAHITDDEPPSNELYNIDAYLAELEDLKRAYHTSLVPLASSCPNPNQADELNNHGPPISAWENADVIPDELTAKPADLYELLNLLNPMDPSGYDPDQACMDGTREEVLNEILTWTQNRYNSESLLWISGQAGMGKTSIATSLCRRLDKIRALAGSFFCDHTDPNTTNPLRLINNLAYMMALRFPPYACEVANIIRSDRSLCTSHFSLRYEGLIKRPLEKLKSLSMPMALVVVIDGLDKCGNSDLRERILHKLYDMSKLVPWLKVVFTGCPTGDIQEYFQNNCSHETIIHLQTYEASPDIHRYIDAQLGKLSVTENWPHESINQLCMVAQGVFLWAALSVKYIKKSVLPASLRLKNIIENRNSPVTNHFDRLYARALGAVMDDTDDETKDAYVRCIAAILTISEREHLAIPDSEYMLLVIGRFDKLTLARVMSNLGPLLCAKEDGPHARFYHSSFRDYISDPSRSGRFSIEIDQYGAEPANCCLNIMQRDLRFNICELETSHQLNNEVPELELRVCSHISPALKYACTHWIDHFISSPNQALIESMKRFLEGPQLMYWIEALSLLGHLDVAMEGLPKLLSLDLAQFDDWSIIVPWITDVHRFLLVFHDAIAASTPHLYVSALAFAPTESLTAQRMRPYFPNTITMTKGANTTWHPCIKTVVHPHAVQSLSISPDGSRIIAGYPDGSLGEWDKKTNAFVGKPIMGHTGSVTCVVFTANGGLFASSSYDATTRVWDTTGRLNPKASHILTGHAGSVHSLAFSPDATILASASSDKTIWLWDPKTMRAIGKPCTGHSGRVSSVAFSSDGAKLASGSWDKTIRVWSVDTNNQKLSGNPLIITGHSDLVTCIAFSPDGSKIASGSADKTIRMWDAQTGRKVEPSEPLFKHLDTITSIAFSPNGKLIASSSVDGVAQIRDTTTLAAFSHPFSHSNAVNGITFSPDGTYILTGSTDMTIRAWQLNARRIKQPISIAPGPFVGHSSDVYSVAISSDGSRIVSGSGDAKVQMWDAQTGLPIGNPYVGHSGTVYSVAISPDGALIVSGSVDKSMKLWDTATNSNVNSYQHGSEIYCSVFSPDGALIAFGSKDKNAYLWDPTTWKMIGNPLQSHSDYVAAVAFSSDSAYLASSSGDQSIMIWDIKTRNRFGRTLSGHTNTVWSIAFSPCGTQLVSGSFDQTVRLWDIETSATILELTGHSHYVMSAVFSPDGSRLASGSFDKTVQLWDTKTGHSIAQPFTKHSGYVRSIAFSPDGQYIVSGSHDKTIQAWSLGTSCPIVEPENDLPEALIWPLLENPYECSSNPSCPGWVTYNQQYLAFWLPAYVQQPDPNLNTPTGGSRSQMALDYSKFSHGTTWASVACDSIRRGTN